jgi:hypothetical protein
MVQMDQHQFLHSQAMQTQMCLRLAAVLADQMVLLVVTVLLAVAVAATLIFLVGMAMFLL